MKALFNKMFLGLLAGVFAPCLTFFCIYLYKYWGEYHLSEIIEQIQLLDLASKLIALNVFLANLTLFYLAYHFRWDKFSKGVLLATLLYAFLSFSMTL